MLSYIGPLEAEEKLDIYLAQATILLFNVFGHKKGLNEFDSASHSFDANRASISFISIYLSIYLSF